MFEWLFPEWSNPVFLTILVGARVCLNVALTTIVAKLRSLASRFTGVAAVLTVVSAALTILVLRGALGLTASYLETLIQVLLIVFTAYVVYSNHPQRWIWATVGVSLGAIALVFPMVLLYGEATVAP